MPIPSETSKFLQIYFVGDEKFEIDQRFTHIQGLKRKIVIELQCLLYNHNQLINVLKKSIRTNG